MSSPLDPITDDVLLQDLEHSEVWQRVVRPRLAQLKRQSYERLGAFPPKTAEEALKFMCTEQAKLELLSAILDDPVRFLLPEIER